MITNSPQILSSDIEDFIGIFDTNFKGDLIIKFFEEVNKTNKVFRRTDFMSDQGVQRSLKIEDKNYPAVLSPERDTEELYVESSLLSTYNKLISFCMEEYEEKYGILKQFNGIQYGVNVQKTLPSQGYHVWHCEKEGIFGSSRYLATMLYLNDVEDGGETEFLYQQRRVKPKEGRIVIWPAQWSHTHRGNPPLSGEKYIATSWIHFRN